MFRLFTGTDCYPKKFFRWNELILWRRLGTKELKLILNVLCPTHNPIICPNIQFEKGCMFSFPAGCVGISLSFQEDPINYCQQIYIFFILATLSTSKNHIGAHINTGNSTTQYPLSDIIWWPVCRSLLIIWSFYSNSSYIYFITPWNCCYWRLVWVDDLIIIKLNFRIELSFQVSLFRRWFV